MGTENEKSESAYKSCFYNMYHDLSSLILVKMQLYLEF